MSKKQKLLEQFVPGDEVHTMKELARRVAGTASAKRSLKPILDDLVRQGVLERERGGRFRLVGRKPDGVTERGEWSRLRKARIEDIFSELGIPVRFSSKAEKEAERTSSQPVKPEPSRADLRALPFVTIDPDSAKDFDDAVTAEKTVNGIRLHVAIADVTHYLKENGPCDREARLRGTSVYYPGASIPMLPRVLTEEACSLQPQCDRHAMVAKMDFDASGVMQSYRFTPAVIRSRKRLTYDEAFQILKTRQKPENLDTEAFASLQVLYDFFTLRLARRLERGGIDLDLPEAKIILDDEDEIADIRPAPRNDAHRLVEECMLAANEAAARQLEDLDYPCLYRIHESPDPEKTADYLRTVSLLGVAVPKKGSPESKLPHVAKEIEPRDDARILHGLLLRCMAQARYSEENLGHYGLGLEHYAHFTSPIRRYPDVIVHRLLKESLAMRDKGARQKQAAIRAEHLPDLAALTSMTERRALQAERAIVDVFQAEYMSRFIGEEFTGRVSGVQPFGLFVTVDEPMCEGLVPVRTMSMDYFDFDEIGHALVGRRNGLRFRLGQKLRVQLVRSDVEDGKLEFGLVHDDKQVPIPPKNRKKTAGTRPQKVVRRSRSARKPRRRR